MSTATGTRNGTDPKTELALPVDSFKDAAPLLRRPFTANAVRFKVQATWPKNGPTGGLIVPYMDSRLVTERLNAVCPHLWHDEYEAVEGNRLMCMLTVDQITRRDIGEGYQGKGLYSDAFKRAAVKFGIGVSLYATPKIILNKGQHLAETATREGKSLKLTSDGENHCRRQYASWLEAAGAAAFGQPLDHGDALDAVGDPAEEPAPPAEAPGDTARQARDPNEITKKRATELTERFLAVGVKGGKVGMWLTGQSVDHDDITTKSAAVEALRQLTDQQADAFEQWVSDQADGGGDQ